MENISLCFKILIGISFLAVLADMLMLEGTFKKYVRSILGLVMLLVMINAFTGIKNISLDFSLLNEADAAQEVQQGITIDLFQDVKQRIEEKIITALAQKEISVPEIDVTLDKDFHLTSVSLKLQRTEDTRRAQKILTEELKIDDKIISFY